jgi:hypothetical protein
MTGWESFGVKENVQLHGRDMPDNWPMSRGEGILPYKLQQVTLCSDSERIPWSVQVVDYTHDWACMKEYDAGCDTVQVVKQFEGDKYKVVQHVTARCPIQ